MKFWFCVGGLSLCLVGCERLPDQSVPDATSTPAAPVPPPVVTPVERAPAPEDAGSAVRAPVAPATLQQARDLQAAGKLAEARELLQPLAETDNPEAVDLLGAINIPLVLTPAPAPEKADYTIVAGDALGKIASRFRTTIELIKQANGLTSDLIRTGHRLRIYQAEFAVVVSKSANTLTLTDHGKLFKRYRVGTGAYSKTPVGNFKITVRQMNPVWHRGDKIIPYGDPANILGTHWLGLDVAGYGIHGTWDTNAIGRQATAGCIRLLNDDVGELYTLLPVGTPVTIRD